MKRWQWVFVTASLAGGVLFYGTFRTDSDFAQVAPIHKQETRIRGPERNTILFVGDVMLSRGVDYHVFKSGGGDFSYPFLEIADVLRSADFTFGNFEGPISSRGANQGSVYSFHANPDTVSGLKFAGFDALSLSNNHIWDWGSEALLDTLILLRANGITPVGVGVNKIEVNNPLRFILGPARLTVFAYTDLYPRSLAATEDGTGVSEYDKMKILKTVSAAGNAADIVIVSLHWGVEYAPEPTAEQQKFAHSLVDAGADLVIGHHPYVVQPIERYKHGRIAYSLGNFVFDQNFFRRNTTRPHA